MSDAKKCDRCGSYFTLDKIPLTNPSCKITTYRVTDPTYDMEYEETRLPVDNNTYGKREFVYGDLCVTCTNELRKWWTSWKDMVKEG